MNGVGVVYEALTTMKVHADTMLSICIFLPVRFLNFFTHEAAALAAFLRSSASRRLALSSSIARFASSLHRAASSLSLVLLRVCRSVFSRHNVRCFARTTSAARSC